MQKSNAFLITSAINTSIGVFDTSTRFTQTLETIDSIQQKCPSAHISLIEMGQYPLQQHQKDILSLLVDDTYDFSNSKAILDISTNTNIDVIKNLTEMFCFKIVLAAIRKNKSYNNIKRFFKVSGRYVLTDDFNLANYDDAQDKIVFAKLIDSQFPPELTDGILHQYMSRCWSFPATLIDVIEDQFEFMLEHFERLINSNRYIDIEHLLFAHTSPFLVKEFNAIGVSGLLSNNGKRIND